MNKHSSTTHRRGLWLLFLCLIAALLISSAVQSAAAPLPQKNEPFDTVTLPPEALTWSAPAAQDKQATQNPKLDAALAELVGAGAQARQALAQAHALRLSGDRVHVQIVTAATDLQDAIRAVETAGGEVTKTAGNGDLIQGWLPISALETVAGDDAVYLIRRPAAPVLFEDPQASAATTEGLAAINGPAWHSEGHTGAGVKVGVIDGGFQGYNGLLGSDLPATVTVKNFVDGETDPQADGTTEHGTACAEVIHDIAPDADLYLAKIGTDLDLEEAVAWLKDTHNVDVISTSLGWYNQTPGDGSGKFANLVQEARDAGIFWTTAASNDREAHWGGLYYDPNNDDSHHYNATQNVNYFGPGDGNLYNIPAGNVIRVFIRWDDWTNVDQDYDLLLLRWGGSSWSVVAQGNNYQNGGAGQTPTEAVAYVSSGAATGYGFVITRYNSNRDVNFEIFAPKVARLDELLHARSLANLADAPGAITVAALDVGTPYPQEPYSSEGPTNGPGGAETGGATKPDISGFANVATESYGLTNKFNGTSSATPHVAGAAALVLGANPGYGPGQLQTFLQNRAIDMGASGKDTLYGYGRLHLGNPPTGGPEEDYYINLPLILHNFPITPDAPVLNAIANDDGDGAYTVSWSSPAAATTYTLQEDDNAAFSSPTVVHSGAATSKAISGKDVGTYYYRVRAANAYAQSAWSNTRSVQVTVEPPACPQTGAWTGTTNQGRDISFDVENAPTCRIAAESLHISIRDSCGFSLTTTYMNSFSIVNDHFSTGSGTTVGWVHGDFISPMAAEGTYNHYMMHPYEPWRYCTASGTWTATP